MAADYLTILAELDAYGAGLAEKPRVTALNKIDALDEEEAAAARAALEAAGARDVRLISGFTGEGVPGALRALRSEIDRARRAETAGAEKDGAEEDGAWRP